MRASEGSPSGAADSTAVPAMRQVRPLWSIARSTTVDEDSRRPVVRTPGVVCAAPILCAAPIYIGGTQTTWTDDATCCASLTYIGPHNTSHVSRGSAAKRNSPRSVLLCGPDGWRWSLELLRAPYIYMGRATSDPSCDRAPAEVCSMRERAGGRPATPLCNDDRERSLAVTTADLLSLSKLDLLRAGQLSRRGSVTTPVSGSRPMSLPSNAGQR